LTALGYTLKEGYYWDGLEKKSDKYKFVWFYGDEYEALKGTRSLERKRDSLLQVNNIEDLLAYRKVYGVSDFTENKILQLLGPSNLAEAKILVEHFTDSKHLQKIELNHLSKMQSINDLLKEKTAKKYLDADPNFDFKNKEKIITLTDRINSTLPNSKFIDLVINDLRDKHIEKNVNFYGDAVQQIDDYIQYAEDNVEWLGEPYVRNKEMSMVATINHKKYGSYKSFNAFYNDLNKALNAWAWKGGHKYGNKLILVETFKGSSRRKQKEKDPGSMIDDILHQKVDNMIFTDLSEDINMDDLSYVRLAGTYVLKKENKEHLPFHAIFQLDKKDKNYNLTELVITDVGVYNTHFNGKEKNKYFYYDRKTKSLKRKG